MALSQERTFLVAGEGDELAGNLRDLIESPDPEVWKAASKRITGIFDAFLEQPYLLDPHLGGLIGPIMEYVRRTLRAWHAARVEEREAAAAAGLGQAFAFQMLHDPHLNSLLSVVYHACKTRGFKHIVKLLPHEVADLEPAVAALCCQDATDHASWGTRYVLLLWLSILSLVPFDLASIDSGGGSGLIASLISICKSFLSDPGPVRSAAALCLARLLSRPDMEQRGGELAAFLEWAAATLAVCTAPPGSVDHASLSFAGAGSRDGEEPARPASVASAAAASFAQQQAAGMGDGDSGMGSIASRAFLAAGVMQALVDIAKHGHRGVLVGAGLADVFSRVVAIANASGRSGPSAAGDDEGAGGGAGEALLLTSTGASSLGAGPGLRASPILRKLAVKLASRTGLAYLPPKVAAWRYQRGQRSLLDNLAAAKVVVAATPAAAAPAAAPAPPGGGDDGGDEGDVPAALEDILDLLLTGLCDGSTVVRWSAAKGVGRITGRLPRSMADDVVAAVLQLLSPSEGDGAWHGGCLALAELARRGLLLPSRLPAAIPAVLQALSFDVRRGAHSIGTHVRDAACYVCWAFARAYAPAVMRPFVADLARGMMVTALFDREVNCRRAASAAYQENVGRQGHESFPNGIDVLTAADYFTLGNRTHAYTVVAPIVARFPQYRYALLDALLHVKLRHWDRDVRELAARSLAALTRADPAWVIEFALPALLPLVGHADLSTRHGAICGIAEAVLALAQVPVRVPSAVLDEVRNVVVKAEKARAYTGRGGEMVRAAMCRLIACQCLAGHALSRKAGLRLLQTVDECLRHPNDIIQSHALAALRALTQHSLWEPDEAVLEKLTRSFVARLRADENPAVRRGMALALGALPRSLLCGLGAAPAAAPATGVRARAAPSSSGGGASSAASLLDDVIDALATASRQERQPSRRDAETRRNAVMALADLVSAVGFGPRARLVFTVDAASGATVAAGADVSGALPPPSRRALCELLPGLTPKQLSRVLGALVAATHDYATDNRGDVGSWVRKAALEALESVLTDLQASVWFKAHVDGLVAAALVCPPTPASVAAIAALESTPSPTFALHLAHLAACSGSAGGRGSGGDASAPTSGYGRIAGYGAGSRLVSSASAYARPDSPATANGLLVGSRVASAHGPGRIAAVVAGGVIAEVSFAKGSTGVCSFPYGSAFLRAASLRPLETSAAAAATADGLRPASFSVVTLAEDVQGYLPAGVCVDVVGCLLRQLSEKLDLLRGAAGEALCRILHLPAPLPAIPGIPHRARLHAAFPPPVPPPLQPEAASASISADAAALAAIPEADAGGEEGDAVVPAVTEPEALSPALQTGDTAAVATAPSSSSSSSSSSVQWSLPHDAFPRVAGLLDLPEYTPAIAQGLVTSVGGLSESVVKHSAAALLAWAKGPSATPHALAVLGRSLTALLRARPKMPWDVYVDAAGGGAGGGLAAAPGSARAMGGFGAYDPTMSRWFANILGGGLAERPVDDASTVKVDSRLVTPALRTIETLLRDGAFDVLQPPAHAFGTAVIDAVNRRVAVSREDVGRVLAAGDVLLGLLHFEQPVRGRAMQAALSLLGHAYPRVRKAVAEALYVRMLVLDDTSFATPRPVDGSAAAAAATEGADVTARATGVDASAALELLSVTAWDGPVDEARVRRGALHAFLGVEPSREAAAAEAAAEAGGSARGRTAPGGVGGGDEDDGTYGALVREMGY